MEASIQSSRHIVAITPPYYGHAIRLIRLSMKLASMGFTITFISTHSMLKSITPEAAPFISMNKIHLTSIEEDLNLKELIFPQAMQAMASCKMPEIDKLVQTAEIKQNCPVCCILSDILLLPFLEPIRENRSNCQIAAVAVSCASLWLLFMHLDKLMDDSGINFSAFPAVIPDLPTTLSIEDFPFILLAKRITSKYRESLVKHMKQVNWIVINTFEELEGYALDALRQTYKLPILSVGPLHIFKGIEKGGGAKEEDDDERENNFSEILSWLSMKEAGSVIYVSFGTSVDVSIPNIQELAMGLEASNHNFLWVLRPSSLVQCLPEGFVERNKERGLIVEWCPQVQVLKHSSVGAFLTHGGWNSILEAVSYGVPMLGWPQFSEQNFNCKLLTDVWKFGGKIDSGSGKHDGKTRTVGREQIEVGIRSIMEGARSGETLKERSVELQLAARRAVAENGSSTSNLLHLVKALTE